MVWVTTQHCLCMWDVPGSSVHDVRCKQGGRGEGGKATGWEAGVSKTHGKGEAKRDRPVIGEL
eukprot:1137346-Pelagomonas_calceolata.AAC.1